MLQGEGVVHALDACPRTLEGTTIPGKAHPSDQQDQGCEMNKANTARDTIYQHKIQKTYSEGCVTTKLQGTRHRIQGTS